MPRRRRGFTLIELLVVIVILGVLATIALLRFQHVSDQAAWATMESDLRTLSIHQELYHEVNFQYSTSHNLVEYNASAPGDSVTITFADATGWAAFASHIRIPGHRCALFMGTAPPEPPATKAGLITCDR